MSTTEKTDTEAIHDALGAIGLAPIPFRVSLSRTEFAHVQVGGLGWGNDFPFRLGVTKPDGWWWERCSIAEWVLDQHRIPASAATTLERIRTASLSLACSIMVWSRGLGMQQPLSRDRMLVLECSNGTCIPLCRWNG